MSQFCARSVIQEVVSGIQRPEGFQQALKPGFTPYYNGVNTYVELPEWKPKGDWEIECYVRALSPSAITSWDYIIDFRDGNDGLRIVWAKGYNGSLFGHGIDSTADKVPLATLTEMQQGVHIKLTRQMMIDVGMPLNNTFRNMTTIGSRFNKPTSCFKGQISNLKLIDKENPSNSRFYPGVIYSYVDPDATNVPMPVSTVLIDEWCEAENVKYDFTLNNQVGQPESELLGSDGFVWRATPVSGAIPADHSVAFTTSRYEVGSYYLFEFNADIISGGLKFGTPDSGSEANVVKGFNTIIRRSNRNVTELSFYRSRHDAAEIRITGFKITKVTHGILTNLGSHQPYVPLLGDRDEYCPNYNGAPFIRGVSTREPLLAGAYPASFNGKIFPASTILVAGSVSRKVLVSEAPSYDIRTDGEYSQEFQHAFQYPNVFKVIKPTDPDYGDYL